MRACWAHTARTASESEIELCEECGVQITHLVHTAQNFVWNISNISTPSARITFNNMFEYSLHTHCTLLMRCTYWLEVCASVCMRVYVRVCLVLDISFYSNWARMHVVSADRVYVCVAQAQQWNVCHFNANSSISTAPRNTHAHRGLFHRTGDHFRWGMGSHTHTHIRQILYTCHCSW